MKEDGGEEKGQEDRRVDVKRGWGKGRPKAI